MICPDSHKHQLTTTCKSVHGCKCEPCRLAYNEKYRIEQRRRRRAKAYGRFQPKVPAIGTQRRIQGLQVLGWRLVDIAEAGGWDTYEAVQRILLRDAVTVEIRDRVAAATKALVQRGRGPSNLTTIRSEKKGWVSLFLWDDIDSDPNPAEKVAYDPTLIDDVRVMHAVDGRPGARLTGAERREAVKILHARKWTDNRIAHQLGCHEQTVFRIRGELGLPAYAFTELVKKEAA